MKRIVIGASVVLAMTSCVEYKNFQPQANTALFANKGEVQARAGIGTSGVTFHGAGSITENLAVTAMYHSTFNSRYGGDFSSEEMEIGFGYYTPAEPLGIFISGGLGGGNNTGFTDSTLTVKSYEGSYYKPFVQLNAGISAGTITGGLKGSLKVAFKMTGLFYNGRMLDGSNESLRSSYLLLEPVFVAGLGTQFFQFEIYIAYPLRGGNLVFMYEVPDAPTLPITAGFGLNFTIGRDSD